MTAKREYLDYLQDIFESIGDIEVFVAGMDFERFATDKRTVNAVIRSLEVIGEAAKKIPKDISDAHPGVPWSKMCAMRDKLTHEYFGVDRTILWKVATEEIPPLKDVFRKILEEHR